MLKVYNILGQDVETLIEAPHAPGTYEVPFSARDLPSGLYLYVIQMGNYRDVKKMLLLK